MSFFSSRGVQTPHSTNDSIHFSWTSQLSYKVIFRHSKSTKRNLSLIDRKVPVIHAHRMSQAAIVAVTASPLATVSPASARLVEAFLAGRKATTLAAYRADLQDFATFVGAVSMDEAAALLLSRSHGEANGLALAYRASLVGKSLSGATVNRRLAALRSLVKLGRTLGLVSWGLEVDGVDVVSYRDTRGPGLEGFRKMLARLDARLDEKGRRDRAILRLLFVLALRRGEVCSLDVEHVDLARGTLAILGKGRSDRELLTLAPAEKEALAAWLSVRGSEPGALFISLDRASRGHRITGRAIYKIVSELGEDVDLVVRPHGLRHAAITELLERTGGNVRKVQKFSRHRDVRVLNVYDDNRADVAGELSAELSAAS